jgi:hypothetical protein
MVLIFEIILGILWVNVGMVLYPKRHHTRSYYFTFRDAVEFGHEVNFSSLDSLSKFKDLFVNCISLINFGKYFWFSLPPLPHFIFVTLHELDAPPNFSLQYVTWSVVVSPLG